MSPNSLPSRAGSRGCVVGWRGARPALAATARLHPRQVQLVRVAFAYLRQAGLGSSRAYVQDILLQNPEFVQGWVEFFESRFDPVRRMGSNSALTDGSTALLR